MADNSESSAEGDTASSTESNSHSKKAMKPKAEKTANHRPSTADMVVTAIKALGERGGSSLIAIKKYIGTTYNVDTEKLGRYIKKFLKAAVESGEIVQTKGKGATGSFKLPSAKLQAAKLKQAKLEAAESEAAKKSTVKKTSKKTVSSESTAVTKKQASSKVTKKDSTATVKNPKTTKNAIPKSPKAKKMARSPTTKPKAPKPKKVSTGGKSPKVAASKKATAMK